MKILFFLVVIAVVAAACDRQPGTKDTAKTNLVSKLDDRGRPMETTVYATNGVVKRRTFFETTDDGRVLSARTVDKDGKLKWIDQYMYQTGTNQQPIEIQRVKPNGETVAVRFVYSPDGSERKIVIGPNGQPVPEAEQAEVLEE
jgi:hypothetical protein